jgi:hypothetical protein
MEQPGKGRKLRRIAKYRSEDLVGLLFKDSKMRGDKHVE